MPDDEYQLCQQQLPLGLSVLSCWEAAFVMRRFFSERRQVAAALLLSPNEVLESRLKFANHMPALCPPVSNSSQQCFGETSASDSVVQKVDQGNIDRCQPDALDKTKNPCRCTNGSKGVPCDARNGVMSMSV
uniref:EGF-like domain-containing protein n=1 Tax=Ascaris lumbricoides TaxID=6252 RepID=A0A0M3HPR0_ASCLU